MSNATQYDAPWDFTRQRDTHRFPPATYLRPEVARAERTHAEQMLKAVNDAASVRVGLAGGLTVGLLIAVAVVSLGHDELTRSVVVKLAILGGALLVVVTALMGLISRHTAISAALSERVRHDESRLARLEAAGAARP
ncbi:MAG TPA: hypothetical protein VJN29_05695 [Intrasporangium sp.]|uniref:hypothetical protein n=1 Tax=Intrasporangium sp. TaxID=1925024 RepID=UPI002B467531|nr:hypothetical protein [Intrasporangium sp.]HKX66701.1 hypothetical protein [Intrasporangium sp.]